jgi:hypothetical protein
MISFDDFKIFRKISTMGTVFDQNSGGIMTEKLPFKKMKVSGSIDKVNRISIDLIYLTNLFFLQEL